MPEHPSNAEQEEYWAPQKPRSDAPEFATPRFEPSHFGPRGVCQPIKPKMLFLEHDFEEYWPHVIGNIALAGLVYPSMLAIVIAVVWSPWIVPELIVAPAAATAWGIGYLLAFAGIAGVVGLLYAGLSAVFLSVLVSLVLTISKLSPRWDRLGAFCGALAALVCLGWPAIYFEQLEQWIPGFLAYFWLGPALGTIVGQAFGVSAGIGNMTGQSPGRRLELALSDASRGLNPFRFSLQQAMWLTFWLCLGLGLLRANVALAALFCPWLPFQTVSSVLVLKAVWSRERRVAERFKQRAA